MTKDELQMIVIKNASHVTGDICIDDNMGLIDDLGYDSLDFVQLIIEIEEKTGMDFLDEDLLADNFTSVGSLWDMICKRAGN